MAKRPSKHGRDWSTSDLKSLRQLKRENTPTRIAALQLGRTPGAVHQKSKRRGYLSKAIKSAPVWHTQEVVVGPPAGCLKLPC